jgi:hypothetical protein
MNTFFFVLLKDTIVNLEIRYLYTIGEGEKTDTCSYASVCAPWMISQKENPGTSETDMRVILKTNITLVTKNKIYQLNSTTTLTKCFAEQANSLSKMTDKSTSYCSIM